MEEGIGCGEGRVGWRGWATLKWVGWWEVSGQCDEGLEVVDEGSSIREAGTGAFEGLAVFNPSDPSGSIYIWKNFRFNPVGELGWAAWIL